MFSCIIILLSSTYLSLAGADSGRSRTYTHQVPVPCYNGFSKPQSTPSPRFTMGLYNHALSLIHFQYEVYKDRHTHKTTLNIPAFDTNERVGCFHCCARSDYKSPIAIAIATRCCSESKNLSRRTMVHLDDSIASLAAYRYRGTSQYIGIG